MVFCPKCGKQGAKGLCDDCRQDDLLESFKEKSVEYCFLCKKVNLRGRWTECRSLKEAVTKVLEAAIKKKSGEVKVTIVPDLTDVPEKSGIQRKADVLIMAVKGAQRQEYNLGVDVLVTACPKCGKMGTDYIEGTLQLRGITKERSFIIDFVRKELTKLNDKGLFISKEKVYKDGIDFVVTRKKYLRSISQKIVDEFGGVVSHNTKVFSMDKQTMKDILRLNVLVTLPPFFNGDVICVGGAVCCVSSTRGKAVNCVDLLDGKRRSFESDRKRIVLIAKKGGVAVTSISRLVPHVEVLHPETFESVAVRNETFLKATLQKAKLREGKKVEVIESDGLWFVA